MKILIVEDEVDIRKLISLNMKKEGYEVFECKDGREALEVFNKNKIDLILLDIMMPEITGFDVMEEVRKKSTVPIICITAMGTDGDKVLGLGLGADDYLVKPINTIELTARVAAQLRRCYEYVGRVEVLREIRVGGLTINKDTFQLSKNGEVIDLNLKQFKIIELLMSSPGRVFTKKQIYENVWDEIFMDDNTLLVHLSRLREKIEDDPKNPAYIKTIRGIGYKIERM